MWLRFREMISLITSLPTSSDTEGRKWVDRGTEIAAPTSSRASDGSSGSNRVEGAFVVCL